ncbi:MAG: hypothetical protein RIG63_19845 [Coleofasciculus chthonoplastes F3-SA18-01]
MSQPIMNACSQIQCPFCDANSSDSGCMRYSHPTQCHLTSMFEFDSDDKWLFKSAESEFQEIQTLNNRFINKDKASRKQLQQLKKKSPRSLELPIPQAIPHPRTETQLQLEG